jgi:STE24 endopeptidase
MNPEFLFYLIIAILVLSFAIDQLLDYLNARRFNSPLPAELKDVYQQEEYRRSQEYKRTRYRFGLLTSFVSFAATLVFLFLDGFAYVDRVARSFSDNELVVALIFFGIIAMAAELLGSPFAYYQTFVIEERFGFNKSSRQTFFLDKLKGMLITAILGGGLLALIIWFYQQTGADFWLYAWGLVTLFTVLLNMFYARLIVPLFNKQTPLPGGSLRDKIESYAHKVGFEMSKIFVIDGSKRSSKANAYFSGFGREKRVTLYDTLIDDLEEEEIVAVLAHEVGHYKKKHIVFNLAGSVILSGVTLWLLSLFIGNPTLSAALGVSTPAFHIGLITFGLLYSPVSELTGLAMNAISRTFEYQADRYAKESYNGQALISALKKLNSKSLSNLTPHPAYVFVHYSHPTLLQRFRKLSE